MKSNSLVAAKTEAPSMLTVIAEAARDPSVDPVKLRELLTLHRELEQDVDRRAFYAAMSQVQGEIKQIATDAANPQTNSKYASYAALDAALRPYYTSHGFSVSFDSERLPDGWVRVTCIVSRGAWETRHHADVAADGKGAKGGAVMTATHAAGSALSYGKRYSLAMAFNLAVARDDDGNRAGARHLTRVQVEELEQLAFDCGVDVETFFPVASEHLGYEIKSFGEIHRNDFGRVRSSILARKKKEQQG